MRGIDLDPNFGKREMYEVLREYGRYIKPVKSRAEQVNERSKGTIQKDINLEK